MGNQEGSQCCQGSKEKVVPVPIASFEPTPNGSASTVAKSADVIGAPQTANNSKTDDAQDNNSSTEASNGGNSSLQSMNGENLAEAESARSLNAWVQDQEQFAHLPPLADGWIRVKSRNNDAIYYCNTHSGETTFTEPDESKRTLAPGWVEMVSRSTGEIYYWNSELEKSQFEFPTAAGEFPVAIQDDSLPPGWVSVISKSTGKVYYFHAETEVSQFERPK